MAKDKDSKIMLIIMIILIMGMIINNMFNGRKKELLTSKEINNEKFHILNILLNMQKKQIQNQNPFDLVLWQS